MKKKRPILKKLGAFGKRIALGIAADPFRPVLGAVKGFAGGFEEAVIKNVDSPEGGQGKVDWVRMSLFISAFVLLALYAFGLIDREMLEYLLVQITKLFDTMQATGN